MLLLNNNIVEIKFGNILLHATSFIIKLSPLYTASQSHLLNAARNNLIKKQQKKLFANPVYSEDLNQIMFYLTERLIKKYKKG